MTPSSRGALPLAIPLLVSLGILAGLLREIVLASLFGTGELIEVYRVATGLPLIFAESVAAAVVSVVIASASSAAGQPPIGFRVMFPVAIVVAAVGAATMPLQAALLAPGFGAEQTAALVTVGRWAWLMFALSYLSLLPRARVLGAGVRWPSASTQIVRSSAIIAGFGLLLALDALSSLVGIGIVLAGSGVALLLHHGSAWWRVRSSAVHQAESRPSAQGSRWAAALPLLALLPLELMHATPRLIDRAWASVLPQGTLASFEFSYSVTLALASVLATTAILVVTPWLAAPGSTTPVRVVRVVRAVPWIGAAVAAACSLAAVPIVTALFARGAFGEGSVLLTAAILKLQVLTLPILGFGLCLIQLHLVQGGGVRPIAMVAGVRIGIKTAVVFASRWAADPLLIVALGVAAADAALLLLAGLSAPTRALRAGVPGA